MKAQFVKKVSIILAIGIFLVILSLGVTSNDASGRAIIVGVGIDFDEDSNQYITTSEVLSPSGAGGVQSSTKYLVTRGQTISQSLFEIFNQTGELTSLGQCQIIILGEDFFKSQNIRHCVTYFNLLEALIDSASICCCVGSAFDLMQTQTPHEQSTSFGLSQILKDASASISLPSKTIGEFSKNQLVVGKSDGVTLVEFEWQQLPSNLSNFDTEATIGSYNCKKTAVFKDYDYVATLDEDTTMGFALVASQAVGQQYAVHRDQPKPYEDSLMTVVVSDKDTSIDCTETAEGYKVSVELDVGLQSANRAYWGDQGKEIPLIKRNITEQELLQAKQQIQTQAQKFLDAQQQYNFDISKIFKSFEKKYGKQWKQKSQEISMDELVFELKVETHET